MELIAPGLYDTLLHQDLAEVLKSQPELRAVLGKLEPEEQPARYAGFLSQVLEKALRLEDDPEVRLRLCNELIHRLSAAPSASFLQGRRLVHSEQDLLLEVAPRHVVHGTLPRPESPLVESSLFTGAPSEPQLALELDRELRSADAVDLLVSFIKWSGLRLLLPAIEAITSRGIPLRVITTSYMGASDPQAVEWLASRPGVQVRVSYDTERTRLHAKAYHFHRATGFSTAYIGSSNLSHPAMTSGLEWNLKVTEQDSPHILDKFRAEFQTYWNSREFIPFDPAQPQDFRAAIRKVREVSAAPAVWFDLKPHPFQERILDSLRAEREVHGHARNLVVAATGTGKTMVAAFDYQRFRAAHPERARLLFVAHRREILEQAAASFRQVLRLPDFGELLVGSHQASRLEHLFCSVDMLGSRRLWERLSPDFFDYIVVDEVHHGPAPSYRDVFDRFQPCVLLGLTATPERMDGASVAADFGNRFAAEIRLAEALEEKLLCPFQYFGVADPVALDADAYWRAGKYDLQALEQVYTGAHALAQQRLDAVEQALRRFEPDLARVRGLGFCATVGHAEFMAARFNERGILSATITGDTTNEARASRLSEFRAGRLRFLFTRDVFNEGLDVPEINTVLFLRPTESLTVFLQQLGRGLRHAPEKECLTVIDFVGHAHRRYRIDRKLAALLTRRRHSMEREVESGFPHLPPGCSIQLDRIARDHVLRNIRENLKHLSARVPEQLECFTAEANAPLTFANFVRYHDYAPEALLHKQTWSEWKAAARLSPVPVDPDQALMKPALISAAQTSGPVELQQFQRVVYHLSEGNAPAAVAEAGDRALLFHYRLWGKPAAKLNLPDIDASFARAAQNPTLLRDLGEVLAWAEDESRAPGLQPSLPFPCPLELHATYGNDEIKAALGLADLRSAGMAGAGLMHVESRRAYVCLVTFQKTEREFSPSTMYQDYPISRELLHWESPSVTSLASGTGQNLVHHQDRGYTVLFFVRTTKRIENTTAPFTYLGPGRLESHESERPIRMVWRLAHEMPADVFEENRRGG